MHFRFSHSILALSFIALLSACTKDESAPKTIVSIPSDLKFDEKSLKDVSEADKAEFFRALKILRDTHSIDDQILIAKNQTTADETKRLDKLAKLPIGIQQLVQTLKNNCETKSESTQTKFERNPKPGQRAVFSAIKSTSGPNCTADIRSTENTTVRIIESDEHIQRLVKILTANTSKHAIYKDPAQQQVLGIVSASHAAHAQARYEQIGQEGSAYAKASTQGYYVFTHPEIGRVDFEANLEVLSKSIATKALAKIVVKIGGKPYPITIYMNGGRASYFFGRQELTAGEVQELNLFEFIQSPEPSLF